MTLQIGAAVQVELELCAEDPGPRKRLVGCTKPLWDAVDLAKSQPYMFQDWMNYHLELGVDHLQIYDLDGSFAGPLRPFMEAGTATHVPNFADRFDEALGEWSDTVSHFCLEPHAQDHCIWSWRGRADWVVAIESPDVFLWSTTLSPNQKITDLLEGAWESQGDDGLGSASTMGLREYRHLFAGALIRQVHFGGPPVEGARSLLDRFIWRERDAYLVGAWEYPIAHPWHAGLMNVINFTGRNDGRVFFRFEPQVLRVDHYVDIFRPRCEKCNIRDEAKGAILERVIALRREEYEPS